MICFIIIIIKMIRHFPMNKKNILELFDNEEYIEISIVEMPYNEYLVELNTFGKTMSVITDDWEVLLNMF